MTKKERIIENYRSDDLLLNAGYYQVYGGALLLEIIGRGLNDEYAVNKTLGADFRDQTRKLRMAAEHIAMARKIMAQFDDIIPKLFTGAKDKLCDMDLLHKDANEVVAFLMMYLWITTANMNNAKVAFDWLKDGMKDAPNEVKLILHYFLRNTDFKNETI